MLQIPRLDEVMRVTDNANKLAAAGFSFNEIQDLKKQEVLQQMNRTNAMGNGPQFGVETGFTTGPRRYAEGGTVNISPNGRLLMKPSQPGVVPPEIAAANPGAYWSPKRQSVVIGDPKRNTEKAVGGFTWSGPAIKDGQFFANTGATTFGMPGPGKRRGTIGGRATPPAPDMFGRQFMKPTGPAPEGTTTSGGVSRAPMPWELPGYSDGGTIIGPGGPKDDMIPAMVDGMEPIAVSNGEEIVDAETRDYFGRKFFLDLKKKAEKGMEEAKHHTEEGHGEKRGFAEGGTATQGFFNPYADDPMAAALAEQRGKDARLAAIGGADLGGGRTAFINRYGSGYAVPASDPLAMPGPGRFASNGGTMTAVPGQGLKPMPDIVPAGPWSAGALPWEGQAQTQGIDYALRTMQKAAPDLRALDLAANASRLQYEPKGSRIITVPDARPDFGDGRGVESATSARYANANYAAGGFMAPWEKDAAAAAAREAQNPAIPDMSRAESRRFLKTPQGIQYALKQAEETRPWTQIPGTNYMQGPGGQTVPMAQAARPMVTPEQAAAMGFTTATLDSQGNATYKPANPPEKPLTIRGRVRNDKGRELVEWSDGVRLPPPRNISPTDDQKQEAFYDATGQTLDTTNPEHWSDAYYFARGERPPRWKTPPTATTNQPPPAAAAEPAPRRFASVEEAMKAGLKKGDRVSINGKMATFK